VGAAIAKQFNRSTKQACSRVAGKQVFVLQLHWLLRRTDQKPAAVGMAYMPGLFTFGDGKDDIDASEITAASKISHPDPSLLPPFIDLVRGCLSERPADRPNFEAISTRLQEMLQQVQGA
jgi:hypothetical protein